MEQTPAAVTQAVLELALKAPALSPRELAVSFVDQQQYFVSESSVYRLLKAHDLITSPAFILMKAADHFAQPTTAPNQLWQTDFTYLRVIGWGWFYLSTVLDDFSRYILEDVAREVIEHGRQIEPTPPDHTQISEIGLPELIGGGGRLRKMVGRLHQDEGGAGDQVVGLQEPV